MPAGWRQEDNKPGEQERVIEIKPEVIRAAMKDDIDPLKAGMAQVTEFIAAQKKREKDAEEAEAARRAAAARKEADDNKPDFIVDPEGAVAHAMKPLAEQNARMAAMIMRDKLLGKMDYYSSDPEFAAKVDAIIQSQPLEYQSNAGIIMAAYKNTFYDMRKEIEEGKVKSQASLNSNGGGNGGAKDDKGDGDKNTIVLTPEEKIYAKKMGIKEEDWAKQKGMLEYV